MDGIAGREAKKTSTRNFASSAGRLGLFATGWNILIRLAHPTENGTRRTKRTPAGRRGADDCYCNKIPELEARIKELEENEDILADEQVRLLEENEILNAKQEPTHCHLCSEVSMEFEREEGKLCRTCLEQENERLREAILEVVEPPEIGLEPEERIIWIRKYLKQALKGGGK